MQALVPKILANLTAKGVLTLKTYKKTAIYLAAQSMFPSVDQTELTTMEAQVHSLTANLTNVKSKHRALTTEVNSQRNRPTDEELHAQIEAAIEARQIKTSKLASVADDNVEVMSSTEFDQIKSQHAAYMV